MATFAPTQIFEVGAEGVRTSGETGGLDEVPGAAQHRRPDEIRRLESVEALRDAEHRVEAIALRQKTLAPALLAIDQDDEILHDEAGGLQRLDRLKLRPTVGDDVIDHDDALARREEKTYGTRRRIEGSFAPGERVVVIDDIVTDGGSKHCEMLSTAWRR